MTQTKTKITPYSTGWAELSDEQKLQALSERKLGKKQIELALYLMAELHEDAAKVVAILDAIREFNAQGRGTAEGEKRVPVAVQIVQALEEHRDRKNGRSDPEYYNGLNDAISVAGRYVK